MMDNNMDLTEDNKPGSYNNGSISDLLLSIVRDEYTKELEHITSLDNKASLVLTVMLSVMTLTIADIPFDKIQKLLHSENSNQSELGLFFVLILGISFGCYIISLLFLYRTIQLKGYERFAIANVDWLEILSLQYEEVQHFVFDRYKCNLFMNQALNDKKSESLKKGIGFCVAGFVSLTVSLIIVHVLLPA